MKLLINSIFVTYTIAVLLFACMVLPAEAADPYGRYGWVTPQATIDGDDFTCGANEIALTLEVRNRITDTPIVVNSAIIAVFNRTVSPRVLDDFEFGSGPRIGPVCYNPDIHSVAYDIDGALNYYNFHSSYVDSNPGVIPRQKAMTGVVWVTPVGEAVEYTQVSPSPSSVTIASTSPQYTYAVNHIHNAYGSNALSMVNFFVVEYNPIIDKYMDTVVSELLTQSGGVGNKTIPAQTLSDGWYGWSLYLHLNKDFAIGSGVTAEDVAKSGFLGLWHPFVLDTTPPAFSVSYYTPSDVREDQTVTFQVDASDVLTGVTDIEIFVDGASIGTCTYAAVNSASCEKTAGIYSAGTYSFYAIARDFAGNIATSTTQTFSVTPVAYPAPLSCTLPTTTVLDTAQAWNGSWYAGLQSVKRVGDYLYVGGTGVDDVQGLYIYDVSDPVNITQVSFFSTYSPAFVQNNSWGNDVISVEIIGSYAYLATHYGGLVIVDISNLTGPAFIAKLPLLSQNPPQSRETWDVQVVGNYAYLAGGKGMFVVDITDKTNPVLVSNLDLGAEISQEIKVIGNHAYVAMGSIGVAVVDITIPSNPVHETTITDGYYPPFGTGSWAYALEAKNNYLYVGAHFTDEIRIYNITNPSVPILQNSIPVSNDGAGNDSPRELHIVGDVMYVGAGQSGVFVFDVTNPAAPTELYSVRKPPILAGAEVWGVVPLNDTDFTRLAFISADTNAAIYTTETQCDPQPNLNAGTPIVSPNAAAVGDQFSIEFIITNTGNGIAGAYDIGDLYIDVTGDGTAEYTVPVSRVIATTDPANGQTITVNWTVPAGVIGGNNYRVGYFADIANEVDEGTGDGPFANWSGWSLPFTVTVPLVPDGDVAGIGCTIPLGAATCDGTFTWMTTDVVTPSLYNETTVTECSTMSDGTNEACALRIGNNLIQIRDGLTVLDDVLVASQCDSGTAWDSGSNQCAVTATPPQIWLRTSADMVRPGQSAELQMGITAEYDLLCTLYGAQPTPTTFVHLANPLEQLYSTTTKPLSSTQIVQLRCEAGGVGDEDNTRIEVLPTMQEL